MPGGRYRLILSELDLKRNAEQMEQKYSYVDILNKSIYAREDVPARVYSARKENGCIFVPFVPHMAETRINTCF